MEVLLLFRLLQFPRLTREGKEISYDIQIYEIFCCLPHLSFINVFQYSCIITRYLIIEVSADNKRGGEKLSVFLKL